MSKARLVVIGSSNTDMVVKSERIPHGGETVLGGEFMMVPGGKGANQAVCAAKLGADVKFVARVGDDKGENAIVVAPGANQRVMPEDVDKANKAIARA